MKIEKQKIIISGFIGLTIGVCSIVAINVNKEIKQVEKLDKFNREVKFTLQENINICGNIIVL